MRLSSIQQIFNGARGTLLRFPAACAASVVACGLAWTMVGSSVQDSDWNKLLLSFTLAIVLFYSLALMNERPALHKAIKPFYILSAGFLLFAGFLYNLLNNGGVNYIIRYAHWLFIMLLSVPFAAYLSADEENGLWQFNKRLFLNACVSALYAGVLFAGISLSLGAVDKLLGFEVDDKVYQCLWIFAAYVFWTWHFMAATPHDYREVENDRTYPKGLKIFTQYVLVPLALIYFLILYAYMAKILWTQEWPQGWVSWLTSTASILGLATFLLLYPVQDAPENRWMKTYAKGFCAAAIPLLIMLMIAVSKRAGQYGLTERRYFLIALAVWLLGVFLYFIFNRKPNIRAVLISCFLFSVCIAGGPWGAYSVSLASQLGRMERTLQKNGMLVNGKTVKLGRELDWEERHRLSACLDYIIEYHGLAPLKKYYAQNIDALADKGGDDFRHHDAISLELMGYMGQTYAGGYNYGRTISVSFTSKNAAADVRGFDTAVYFYTRDNEFSGSPTNSPYAVLLDGKKNIISIHKNGICRLVFPLKALNTRLSNYARNTREEDVPQGVLSIEAENGTMRARLCFSWLQGMRENGGTDTVFYSGNGLLLIKEMAAEIVTMRGLNEKVTTQTTADIYIPPQLYLDGQKTDAAAVAKLLSDKDAEVRYKTANSLRWIDDASTELGLSVLRKGLDDRDPRVKFRVVETLLRYPKSRNQGISTVLNGLDADSYDAKKWASYSLFDIAALSKKGDLGKRKGEIIRALKRHISDHNPYARYISAIVLAAIDPASRSAAIPVFISGLSENQDYGQWQAVRLFKEIAPDVKDAVQPLIRSMQEEMRQDDWFFRFGYHSPPYYQFDAIKAIGTPEALEFAKPYDRVENILNKLFYPVNILIVLFFVSFFCWSVKLRRSGKKVFHWLLLVPIAVYTWIFIENWPPPPTLQMVFNGLIFAIIASIGVIPWLISWHKVRRLDQWGDRGR